MNKNDVSVKLKLPYKKTQFLDIIYNCFEVLNRSDNESEIELYIKGKKNQIKRIMEQIKK